MLKLLTALNNFLGTLLALAIVAILSTAGWFGYKMHYEEKWELEENQKTLAKRDAEIVKLTGDLQSGEAKILRLGTDLDVSQRDNQRLSRDVAEKVVQIDALNEDIDALNKDLQAKQKEIQRLEMAVRLLKVDHRLARITVLSQQGSAAEGNLVTTFRFVEVDGDGQPLEQPRQFTIEGDVVYIDAWVIKFTDDLIALPDPVRFTSFCQFRRIFGELQQPNEGFVLDAVGSLPAAYRGGEQISELEQKIWDQFWDYANNPAKAREAGVRAAHGEAPSIKLMPGKHYKVLLRASDGLTIVTEEPATGQPPI